MKKQYMYGDSYPDYPTKEAKEKAMNDRNYRLAMAKKREDERKAKAKNTA